MKIEKERRGILPKPVGDEALLRTRDAALPLEVRWLLFFRDNVVNPNCDWHVCPGGSRLARPLVARQLPAVARLVLDVHRLFIVILLVQWHVCCVASTHSLAAAGRRLKFASIDLSLS